MTPRAPGAGSKTVIRPEIQALRAIAVGMVVLYHLWPHRLVGGYIGVDIFFVISGYLITSHLWRSAIQERLSLVGFYARRIRRLAPASLTVTVSVIAATAAFVPLDRWVQYSREFIGSVLLVENWILARDSVDYLASENSPSPMQHFWSLSVEEQFYLAWPLIILIVIWLLRRKAERIRLTGIMLMLSVILIASFAYCVWITRTDPLPAYFVTPARVWQFAAGGLLGLAHQRRQQAGRPVSTRQKALFTAMSWAGILWLCAAALLLNARNITYPGAWAAVPVIGTLLMIEAGSDHFAWGPAKLLAWRPVQYIGDISYSIYLWHWPLIVIAPFVIAGDLTTTDRIIILLLTFLLSAVTTSLIENPIRFSPVLGKRYVLTGLIAATIAALFVIAPARALVYSADSQVTNASSSNNQRIADGDECFGAASLANSQCKPKEGKLSRGAIALAAKDLPQPFTDHCIDPLAKHLTVLCKLGDTQAKNTVLVWGDSHAAAWASAFNSAGKSIKRNVIVASRQGCPPYFGAPTHTVYRSISPAERRDCADRNQQILDLVKNDSSISTIVLAGFWENYPTDSSNQQTDYRGTEALVKKLSKLDRKIIVLKDVPLTGKSAAERTNIPNCLGSHLGQVEICNTKPDVSRDIDGMTRSLENSPVGPDITVVDPGPAFCDSVWCYAALGGVPVYADASHLSRTFSRSLGPWIAQHVLNR